VFVYPSAYEGFGLPVLEAMACGAPCVISAGTALAEIAGDAVEIAPPRNAEGLTAAILTLLEDDSVRERLGRVAVSFARGFSWHQAAKRHLEVFTEARQRRAG
jgi:glycosyltransferase involved in cell wall biosynthesis